MDEFIERKIVIGLITSTQYITEVAKLKKLEYLDSSSARLLSSWCFEYYNKYNTAPGKEIESIFAEKIRNGLREEQIEDISNILSSLSDEAINLDFNVQYLLDQTVRYLKQQELIAIANQIKNGVEKDEVEEVEKLVLEYLPVQTEDKTVVDPFDQLETVKSAFLTAQENVIKFPKALGQFWNEQLVRGGFVALLAAEKRGKSYLLLEMAMRAVQTGSKVAFFQAGDMTEEQQLRRMYIYLAKRSDRERYCKEIYMPVVDCWFNQTGECSCKEREGVDSLFTSIMKQNDVTKEILLDAIEATPGYLVCRNCNNFQGAVYLEKQPAVEVLTWKGAYKKVSEWRKKYAGKMKLSTHPNDSLSVRDIDNILEQWRKVENFIPDVVIVDYADILIADPDATKLDWRNQQNAIWKKLRKLSQVRDCLVLTATQAAASSYKKDTIDLTDFSEDKRKFAHVTAMYGMNQTPEEKKLGILRLNELVVRESDFDSTRQVKVLQCLSRGRPLIGSYF
jgi:hypothetical protein